MILIAIKYTLYSLSISVLLISAVVHISDIHMNNALLADMALFGVISIPIILALNYIALMRAESSELCSTLGDDAKVILIETERRISRELNQPVEAAEPLERRLSSSRITR